MRSTIMGWWPGTAFIRAACGAGDESPATVNGGSGGRLFAAFMTSIVLVVLAAPARAQCQSDDECKGDRQCDTGRCVTPRPAASTCTSDIECDGDLICEAGLCTAPAAAPAAAVPSSEPVSPAPAPTTVEAPPVYPATVGAPGPDRGTTTTEPITELIIAGAVTLGSVWALSLSTTGVLNALEESDTTGRDVGLMALPVLGPWVMLGVTADDVDYDDYRLAFAMSGLLQAGGLTMLILGVTLEREVTTDAATLRLTPSAPGSDAGLQLTGRF